VLISRRKEGETLKIGDNVEIRVIAIHKKKVILGVIAPRDVKITVGRLADVEMANTKAAVSSANLDHLVSMPQANQEGVFFTLEESSSKSKSKTTDKTDGASE
jgi:carbon storage regulator